MLARRSRCVSGRRRYDRDVATKPEVKIAAGPPPEDLAIEDLTVGTGAEATTGKTVDVHYVGVAWSTGEEFDSSWGRGAPLRSHATSSLTYGATSCALQ